MTDLNSEDLGARTLRVSRDVQAPVALVWTVLTDPAHLRQWWGPTGFITETQAYDLRPGGAWRLSMHGPDGHVYEGLAIFEAIEPPHRLTLRYIADEATGAVLHTTVVSLVELGPQRTQVSLDLLFPTAEARKAAAEQVGAVEGGRQTLSRLSGHVATLQGAESSPERLVLRRMLAATPEQVWAVWTDAAHLHAWFHPEVWRIEASDLDLRVGGTFFYKMSGPGIPPMWALWRFTELDAPRRLAFELCFADADRNPTPSPFGGPWPLRIANTVTIERHAGLSGGSVLTLTSVPLDASDAERDAFLASHSDMQQGWGQTFDSLVAHLQDQAAPAA